jgi:hypothetical protein
MRRLLQSIIYNRKLYDRPQDEWICGRAAQGCPCVFGPGADGECRATSQCLPAKIGDRWVCTRAISLGAACGPGPLPDGACGCPVPPCWPQRSLRAQRGRLTWFTVCAALGVVVLALWGRHRAEWTIPGPLTAQHATSAQHCADCHVEQAPLAITTAALADRRQAHDRLCLECHDLGPQSTRPHGVTDVQLVRLAARSKAGMVSSPWDLVVAQSLNPGGRPDLACAACHQEHHGRDFNLKQMADQQCQVCHQKQFASFTSGHPEFWRYPYGRRTRLQFDHVAHWQKHFAEPRFARVAPTSCATCHEPAADGRRMLVRDFEKSCAQCHAAQIEGEGRAGPKGLVFIRLPAFDTAALEKAGAATGEWPDFCEGGLTPFMRWMLEGDATASAALTVLGPVNLANLSSASPAQKAAAAQLLWSVKGLLADLVTQGQQVMLHRMGPPAMALASTAGRTGQLPADGLLAAQQAWLPNLLVEVAAYRRGEKPARHPADDPAKTRPAGPSVPPAAADQPAPATGAKSAASDDLLTDDLPAPAPAAVPSVNPPAGMKLADAELRVAEGGWYRRDETYTLYYRPGGHADRFLPAWLDATAGDASPAARAIFNQLSDEQAPGVCMKCHTVDQTKTATIVNWRASRLQPNQHEFTTFKHAAHFSLMGDQGCVTCHVFDAKAAYAASFGTNHDPAVFHSNFAPIAKKTCTACHQPGIAGASCLECHNYHTGEAKMLRVRAADFHGVATGPPAEASKK